MSKTMDTSQWIAFFRKAGLPANVSANYALIFFDNRIQLDMLLDLSKEYLYDMGIKVMGDVIAILKFAKEFHNQLAKERVIGNTGAVPKTPVGRMVGHYTRPSPVRGPSSPSDRGKPKKSTIINLKRKNSAVILPKRIRGVPPEEEGAYKIKMPMGTTERSRKILQQQQAMQNSKRSVFSRLGDSAVSSSTDTKVGSSVFERLGPSSKSGCDDMPSSTVFHDLDRPKGSGGGAPLQYQGVLKMTVGKNRTVTTSNRSVNLGNRTVLKPGGIIRQNITKTVKLNQINSILQSGSPGKTSFFRSLNKNEKRPQIVMGQRFGKLNSNVKNRLGAKIDARNMTRTGMLLAKNRAPLKKSANVFERLGR